VKFPIEKRPEKLTPHQRLQGDDAGKSLSMIFLVSISSEMCLNGNNRSDAMQSQSPRLLATPDALDHNGIVLTTREMPQYQPHVSIAIDDNGSISMLFCFVLRK